MVLIRSGVDDKSWDPARIKIGSSSWGIRWRQLRRAMAFQALAIPQEGSVQPFVGHSVRTMCCQRWFQAQPADDSFGLGAASSAPALRGWHG